jgi:hypothetical protein
MEKEFVPYELALKMKQLGFDEPCFAYYYTLNGRDWKFAEKTEYYKLDDNMNIGGKFTISAPLFQQAFRWFRDKHDLVAAILPFQDIEDRVSLCYYYSIVDLDECKDEDILCNESSLGASDINFSSHPEAELACLEKLIKIVEQKEK